MNKQYSTEFKIEAVKRLEKSGETMSKVAADLGVKATTMQSWVTKYKKLSNAPFVGSGHLSPEDEKLRKLEKEIRDLKGEKARMVYDAREAELRDQLTRIKSAEEKE